MKIKLDENLPAVLLPALSRLGHDVDAPSQESLNGAEDSLVWEAAQQGERFLITQDLDFSDVRRFAPGTHFALLLVRLREPSRRSLAERIEALFQSEDASEWAGCFVVATDRKVRVRRS